tara:strand:- start:1238 stop:1501 length:264 start_codon:yes stop_codon:yes gene_type:complete
METRRDMVAEWNAEAIVWEPADYDRAIVGVVERCAFQAVAVYDYDMLVKVTMDLGDGNYEEAAEYVDFNIVGCYVGEHTPMTLHRTS